MGKKLIKGLILVLGVMLTVGILSGCGSNSKKEYDPEEIAEFNTDYRSTTNQETNGQYASINVSSIEKREGNLVINIGAPTTEQVNYALDNFLYVRPLDIKGKELKLDKILLNPIGGDIEAELIITGADVENIKWLEIGPYKTNDDNKIIFKVE